MIREIKESDIAGLNNLVPADWKFDYETFLRDFINDEFFYAFIKIKDNRIIGTGNIFFKEKVSWLANIMIDEKYRNQGVGYEITTFLVAFLANKKCDTHVLIATEMGESLYKKVGFKKVTVYQSYESEVDINYILPNSIRALKNSDLESVYKLDQDTNEENRTHLIDKYYQPGFGYFNSNNELQGFFLPKFGRGLVLSRGEQGGVELLKLKHTIKGNRTLLPIENKKGIIFLEKYGLKRGYKCSRMILGKEIKWNPAFIYSYGSGYCG
jgi:GNAT superfamily N-acetyltransferase